MSWIWWGFFVCLLVLFSVSFSVHLQMVLTPTQQIFPTSQLVAVLCIRKAPSTFNGKLHEHPRGCLFCRTPHHPPHRWLPSKFSIFAVPQLTFRSNYCSSGSLLVSGSPGARPILRQLSKILRHLVGHMRSDFPPLVGPFSQFVPFWVFSPP